MADENGEDVYNSGLRNNGDDADQNDDEYPSNVIRVEPDIGLGSRTQQREDRQRRGGEHNSRREDGPISFRHFLQNDTTAPSASAVCPDLYSYPRLDGQNADGSLVDPESPDLPDFVQDHLTVEHMYFSDGSQTSKNTQNLPDFAPPCVPRNRNNERRTQQPLGVYSQGQDNRNRIPLDLPVPNFLLDNEPQRACVVGAPLPFDLTTQANVAANAGDVRSPAETEMAGAGGGGRLPDFLSDGHVLGHGNPRHRDARIVTSENGNGLESYTERHNLIIMLRQENNRLRDELSMLQSVLMKKGDRIKELEDLVMALEISKLQMSSDANTQTMGKTAAEDEIVTLKRELEIARKEILKLQKEKLNSFAELCQRNLPEGNPKEKNANLALKIKEMTTASERLVRELLKIITEMQADVNDYRSDTKSDTNDDPDDPSSGAIHQATSSI